MKQILEYIISKNNKTVKMIHATDATIKKIVKNELDKLGHDANLNHIDVSEVTDMSDLFNLEEKVYGDLNPNISQWDVSKVKDMHGMFFMCPNFNKDISKLDVRNVKNMQHMFYKCENFNQDLSKWDVRNVKYMGNMFYGCKNFNQDLSKWDVSSVEDNISFMFDKCPIKEEYKPKFNI